MAALRFYFAFVRRETASGDRGRFQVRRDWENASQTVCKNFSKNVSLVDYDLLTVARLGSFAAGWRAPRGLL
jgi:hypothetical protein